MSNLATEVLDMMEACAKEAAPGVPVRFEELSAEPGELPRMMMQPQSAGNYEQRYISESVRPFPVSLTLRLATDDQQGRLDAVETLDALSAAFTKRCAVLPHYVACIKPTATPPYCLGRTAAFEDWQITFDLTYKAKRGI